jgi:hypothetical protein
MSDLTGLEGVYNWSYSGGSFQVELRPFGSFFCKSYPASATWALVDKKVTVDWKKFGKYELEVCLHTHLATRFDLTKNGGFQLFQLCVYCRSRIRLLG